MKTTKKKLPVWFTGEEYKEGSLVQNPYSGDSVVLDNIALSMYDFLWGCVMTRSTHLKDFRRGMDWFIKNYPTEYMVLLD